MEFIHANYKLTPFHIIFLLSEYKKAPKKAHNNSNHIGNMLESHEQSENNNRNFAMPATVIEEEEYRESWQYSHPLMMT
ncbi:unnamed protein product [Blepharisma stoltei]|uniref:Uncharacterized protein n=1 Tax=Blepharisma stoltei TaxID=1481888 RepID=A0AAU9JNN7_9CILI|nr:unnamed protein product [Blepharisma stoltei]